MDVERVFSQGRVLLPHTRNRLSGQSIRALLCLGEWSRLDLIDSTDVRETSELPELADNSDTDYEMPAGWARIKKKKSTGGKKGRRKGVGKASKKRASEPAMSASM